MPVSLIIGKSFGVFQYGRIEDLFINIAGFVLIVLEICSVDFTFTVFSFFASGRTNLKIFE